MNNIQTDQTPQHKYKLYNLNHNWHEQHDAPVVMLTRFEAHAKNQAFSCNQAGKRYVRIGEQTL